MQRVICRYTKVAAEKLTKTVIETAIAGGGGLVDTLKQSYSLNDLREEEAEQYERSDLVQSWHPAMVPGRGRELRGEQRRARRLQTGSVMALTSDLPGEDVPRRRAASVKQKRPPAASSTARPSSMYGTLPRSVTRSPLRSVMCCVWQEEVAQVSHSGGAQEGQSSQGVRQRGQSHHHQVTS